MDLTASNKQLIIIVLLVLMFLVLAVELMYLKSKKRKSLNKLNETKSEEAFNNIHTTNQIISTMRAKGVEVDEAEVYMKEARQYQARGDHETAISRSNKAKEVLKAAKMRFDREQEDTEPVSSDDPYIEPVTFRESTDDPLLPSQPSTSAVKRPENYMQAKFLLGTVRDLLKKDENQDLPKAKKMFKSAEKEFDNENYTKALSLALKAEKMLKIGNLDHIAETPQASEEEVEEEEIIDEEEYEHRHHQKHTVIEGIIETEASCDSCGADAHMDDAFCRKCGNELDFVVVCPGCETEVEGVDAFCRKCGEKLG